MVGWGGLETKTATTGSNLIFFRANILILFHPWTALELRLRAVDGLSSECGSVPRRVEALCLRRTRLANHTSVLPRH
jgi:hypothetical protein